MLGIIGGSGVYEMAGLETAEEAAVETPWGLPSDVVRLGEVNGRRVAFVPRHGRGHRYSPTTVPYRANIAAMKQLGVTHLLSISAVGSLSERLPPRSLVVPDQIIDRTVTRPRTFFDGAIVAHVGIAEPFCPLLRERLAGAAASVGRHVHDGGTYVCIEGPQFSTKAESTLYRSWGADLIGMTAMPEARLAREAELCYATLALVTDFDVWHESEEVVSVDVVLGHLRANSVAAGEILRALAGGPMPERRCDCATALGGALMTDVASVDRAEVARLGVIGARVLAVGGQ